MDLIVALAGPGEGGGRHTYIREFLHGSGAGHTAIQI